MTAPRFNKGDRVRIVRAGDYGVRIVRGPAVVVERVDGDSYRVLRDGTRFAIFVPGSWLVADTAQQLAA